GVPGRPTGSESRFPPRTAPVVPECALLPEPQMRAHFDPELPRDPDHDPSLEPYASMSRDEILALILEAESLDKWVFMHAFLLDKLTDREWETTRRSHEIGRFLIGLYDAAGDQLIFLAKVSGALAARIDREMPPVGPAHEVN